MPENVTLEELARLVREWAKCDDDIAAHGWDGGPREQAWENAKTAMVSAAELVYGLP